MMLENSLGIFGILKIHNKWIRSKMQDIFKCRKLDVFQHENFKMKRKKQMREKIFKNQEFLKNKKAGIFSLGMVIIVTVLIGVAMYCFVVADRKIVSDLNTFEDLTNQHKKQDHLDFYLNEIAKTSASQAFYAIAKSSAVDKNNGLCTVYNSYIIWDENCRPEADFLEKEFFREYNKSFANFAEKYPSGTMLEYSHSLEEGCVISKIVSKSILVKKASYANYNISSNPFFLTEVYLEKQGISLDDFEKIYQHTVNTKAECRGNEKILECVKKNFRPKGWASEIEKQGNYLVFSLKTKKLFFCENEFKPIELNFSTSA